MTLSPGAWAASANLGSTDLDIDATFSAQLAAAP
jgi:hypothetical protein